MAARRNPQRPPESDDPAEWKDFLDDWQRRQRQPEASLVTGDIQVIQEQQERARRGKPTRQVSPLQVRARIVRTTDPSEFVRRRPTGRRLYWVSRAPVYHLRRDGSVEFERGRPYFLVIEAPAGEMVRCQAVVLALDALLSSPEVLPLLGRSWPTRRLAAGVIRDWVLAHLPWVRYRGRRPTTLPKAHARRWTRRQLITTIARDQEATARHVNRTVAFFETHLRPTFERTVASILDSPIAFQRF